MRKQPGWAVMRSICVHLTLQSEHRIGQEWEVSLHLRALWIRFYSGGQVVHLRHERMPLLVGFIVNAPRTWDVRRQRCGASVSHDSSNFSEHVLISPRLIRRLSVSLNHVVKYLGSKRGRHPAGLPLVREVSELQHLYLYCVAFYLLIDCKCVFTTVIFLLQQFSQNAFKARL